MLRMSGAALAASAAVALVGASGVHADGVPSVGYKELSVSQYVWSGLYLGVGGGAASFDLNAQAHAQRFDPQHAPNFFRADAGLDDDAWRGFGTVQVGYDRLIHEHFLVGAFADYDFFNDADQSFSSQGVQNTRQFSFKGNFETDNVWTVGGRLGYLVHPHFLLYGLAGYSQLKFEGNMDVVFTEPNRPAHALALAVDDRLDGYTLGAGGEVGLHRNVSLKVEYRFSQFDGASASASQPIFIAGCNCVFQDSASLKIDDIDEHSIRAALVLRLGDMHDRRAVEPLK